MTARPGLDQVRATRIAAIAFDYDNDGRLDLLLGNYFKPVNLIELPTPHVLPNDLDNAVNGGGVTLWRNDRRRTLRRTSPTRRASPSHTGWTLDVGHGDFDNDGRPGHLPRRRLRHRPAVLQQRRRHASATSTEEAIGLRHQEGDERRRRRLRQRRLARRLRHEHPDEYMKECNMLWHNNGDGTFTDLSRETGTCDTLWGWAAKFGDFDNDGWLDIFVVNGLRSAGPGQLHPRARRDDHRRRASTSPTCATGPHIGNMTLERLPEEEAAPRNLGDQTFKEMSAEAASTTTRTAAASASPTSTTTAGSTSTRPTPTRPRSSTATSRPAPGNWVAARSSTGTKSNARRDRRARHA